MTQVIETDESGSLTLPAELLGEVKPHMQYIVEVNSKRVTLIETGVKGSAERPEEQKGIDHDTWMQEWRRLAQQIDAAWRGEKSALQELTEMRDARG